MRSQLASALLAIATAGAIGCAGLPAGPRGSQSLPVVPGVGFLFERYAAPLETAFDDTSLGSKVGRATVHHIAFFTYAGLITWGDEAGDMGIAKAARNGGISHILHVDYERFSVLSIYKRITVVVYGN